MRPLSEVEDLPSDSSLDPPDWDKFRSLAHAALDDALQFLASVRDRPVWTPVPAEVRGRLAEPLPLEPQGAEAAYRDLKDNILPYATGNIHPRFFGWVHGTGLASGLITESVAAAMNSNCGGRDHGAIYVERCVLAWCRQLFDYPESSGGLLVSGTSMANLIGLAVARHAKAGFDVRREGLAAAPAALVGYASAEAHDSVRKAFEILGLGSSHLRSIPVDDGFRMRLDLLEKAISSDRRAGLNPFCVVASAGAVNTGAIDPLDAIADICHRHELWFHVDGAFGALCVLSEAKRPLVKGIERADSLAFDFHKWMHVPYDAGCVLVRDGELHRQAFAMRPAYLEAARGLAGGGAWPCEYGVELSRGFRALKVWFAFKEHGVKEFGRKIEENCRQASFLADLVRSHAELELLAPPNLNIVCFRFHHPDWTGPEMDAINRIIVADLQERGIAAPSTTRARGQLLIRCAITNHRSTREDFEVLVEGVVASGRKLLARTGSGRGGLQRANELLP